MSKVIRDYVDWYLRKSGFEPSGEFDIVLPETREHLSERAEEIDNKRQAYKDRVNRVLFLRSTGLSYRKIEEETGIPYGSVGRIVRRHGNENKNLH